MDVTIDELLKGKATRIKTKEFYETARYVEPFLNRMSKYTNDFRIKVQLPQQVTITKKEDINFEDVTYNRVWVQAVLPGVIDNHEEVIGMVYGIDTRKPVVKFYKGGLNRACTNLCVFSPQYLDVNEIQPATPMVYSGLDTIIERESNLRASLEKMHNTPFINSEQNINEALGQWVRKCIQYRYTRGIAPVALSEATAIGAYKLLFEKEDSPYFVGVEDTDMFNVYNAFTELITNDKDKDIINKPEKTLLVKSIIGV